MGFRLQSPWRPPRTRSSSRSHQDPAPTPRVARAVRKPWAPPPFPFPSPLESSFRDQKYCWLFLKHRLSPSPPAVTDRAVVKLSCFPLPPHRARAVTGSIPPSLPPQGGTRSEASCPRSWGALGSTTHCCRGEWSTGILCAGWDRGGGSVPGVVKALGLSTAHAPSPSEGSESFSSKELAPSAWRILASQAPAPLPTVIPRWEQARGRCSRLLPGWPRTRGMLGCTSRRRSAARRAMLAAALPPARCIQSPDGGRQLL